MALLFFDGFDNQTNAEDVLQKWNFATNNDLFLTSNSGGRYGGRRVVFANTASLVKNVPSIDTMICGFAFQRNKLGTDNFVTFRDGSTISGGLTIRSDGSVELFRGNFVTSLGVSNSPHNYLRTTNWYFIEIKWKPDPSSGIGVVRINEEEVINFSGDTQAGSETTLDALWFSSSGTDGMGLDDVYICDATGSTNNDFLGDVRIQALAPIADASPNDFTPLSGVDNYAMVDELFSDEDTTYVESNIISSRDLYTFGNTTDTSLTINAAQALINMKKSDAGQRNIQIVIQSGAGETTGSSIQTTIDYNKFSLISEVDPDTSSAWTDVGIDNIVAGLEVVS